MFTNRKLDSSFDFFTIGSNATYKDFLEIVNLLISSSFNDLTDSRASRLSKLYPADELKPIIKKINY